MKRILLISNGLHFRLNLIKTLVKYFKVYVCSVDDNNKEYVTSLGAEFYSVPVKNRDANPFNLVYEYKKIKDVITQINPDILFSFQLKPNTLGVLAAHACRVEHIISMVEGAGDPFIKDSAKWRFIRYVVCILYKKAFKYSNKVIFLNDGDLQEFVRRKLVSKEKVIKIPGIGVDLNHFKYNEYSTDNTCLMIARMLKTKGVIEYCELARRVRRVIPNAIFNYIGAEGSLKTSDIKEYIEDGSITYLGITSDVRPFLQDCSLFILPSYREGLPMSVMEAEAIGRAIITTNNIGCKESIKDGYNGYYIDLDNLDKASSLIIKLLQNPEQLKKMGYNSRLFAEKNFDCLIINETIVNLLHTI